MKTINDKTKTRRTSPRSTTTAGSNAKGAVRGADEIASIGINRALRDRLKIAAATRGITIKELAEKTLGELVGFFPAA
jgi:hypothetical protein